MIVDHCEYANDDNECDRYNAWFVDERENGDLYCHTSMDNFDLMAFVRRIGIPQDGLTEIDED